MAVSEADTAPCAGRTSVSRSADCGLHQETSGVAVGTRWRGREGWEGWDNSERLTVAHSATPGNPAPHSRQVGCMAEVR